MCRFFLNYCLIYFFSLFAISCQENVKERPILIATSANMQEAMEILIENFTKNTNIDCELIVNSSGKLTAQIKAGAPYNIFASANIKYPKEIYDSGLALNPPKIYGYGSLVLWSTNPKIKPSISLLKRRKH